MALLNSAHSPSFQPSLRAIFRALRREVSVMTSVVRGDLSASVVPSMLFVTAACIHFGHPAQVVLLTFFAGFIYSLLYIYTFCLGNQIAGVLEDATNKPHRALPSGVVTTAGAWLRWMVSNLMFLVVAWLVGGAQVLCWAACWQLTSVAYNFWGLDRPWWGKNLVFMTLGTAFQLLPAWSLVGDLTFEVVRWIVLTAILVGVTFHVQDLRDVRGDQLSRRTTLPMLLGDGGARVLLAAIVLCTPLVVHKLSVGPSLVSAALELFLAALNVLVVLRLLVWRTPKADHLTYKIHTLWFCGLVGSSIVTLGHPLG